MEDSKQDAKAAELGATLTQNQTPIQTAKASREQTSFEPITPPEEKMKDLPDGGVDTSAKSVVNIRAQQQNKQQEFISQLTRNQNSSALK